MQMLDQTEFDKDFLVTKVYEAQADLCLLQEYLARCQNPVLSENLIYAFAVFRQHLDCLPASYARH